MGCSDCHDTNNYPDFADGSASLAATTACDGCHSPGGAFNGTGDLDGQNPDTVAFGAKYNWGGGIYDAEGTTLKFGKEKWCVSCHDGGTSEIDGVAAPNVDLYYTSGHGRPDTNMDCLICHDANEVHVDGEPRTYAFSDEDANQNGTEDMYEFENSGVAYAAGYRLRYVDGEVPLMIPARMSSTFYGYDEETIKGIAFRLCFNSGCHDPSTLFYQSLGYPPEVVTTNFATKWPNPQAGYSMGGFGNQHYPHVLGGFALGWDSDWDCWTGFTSWEDDFCVPYAAHDSMTTCSTCHNVHGTAGSHGSTNEAMIRDGRLEGVRPTSDCGYAPRPGFGFTYLVEDTASGGYPWVTSDGASQSTSAGAVFRNDPSGVNYGCFCHAEGSAYYAAPPPGTNYDASVIPPDSTAYLQYFRPWEDFVNPLIFSGSVDTLDGVTMNGLPGNPVTKGGGLYSATVTSGWSGTVTPTKTGYTFSPASRTYTDVTSDQLDQDYTTSPAATYTISGSAGMDGVIMDGLPGNPETSGGGLYAAVVNAGWSGTVTPALQGYNFDPPSRVYTDVFSDQSDQNYTPTLNTYTVSGSVGTLDGVVMNGLPGNPQTIGGFYSVTVDHGWSGTVTPTKEGWDFNPPSRTYVLLSSDQLNEDYTPGIITYTISGTVGNLDGVTMSGLPGSPQTSGGGFYSATANHGWSGTVTPTKVGYTFSPESLAYDNVTSDHLDQDYTPTVTSYTISGSVGTLDGVTMNGLPGNPETSGGGLYSATVGHGWSGTVTPTKEGYNFGPPNRVYANVNADQLNEDYLPSPATQYFTSPGSHTFAVPEGVTSISVKAWGAGGGGGGAGQVAYPGAGGGGGFAQGTITVTPNETLNILVGGGGEGGSGADCSHCVGGGGGGGGHSGVLRGATELIIAAGGGGGGGGDNNIHSGDAGAGGPGGGTVGVDGERSENWNATAISYGGGGGTQTLGGNGPGNATEGAALAGGSGGAGGSDCDECYAGGAGGINGGGTGGDGGWVAVGSGGTWPDERPGGGGGGAGHYGGGGGEESNHDTDSGGGGGGGSSYTTGIDTGTSSGSGISAGNNSDPDYADNAGQGGAAGADDNGGAGNAGRVVIVLP
jgi:hypothetical protein